MLMLPAGIANDIDKICTNTHCSNGKCYNNGWKQQLEFYGNINKHCYIMFHLSKYFTTTVIIIIIIVMHILSIMSTLLYLIAYSLCHGFKLSASISQYRLSFLPFTVLPTMQQLELPRLSIDFLFLWA
eukprot:Em0008g334a